MDQLQKHRQLTRLRIESLERRKKVLKPHEKWPTVKAVRQYQEWKSSFPVLGQLPWSAAASRTKDTKGPPCKTLQIPFPHFSSQGQANVSTILQPSSRTPHSDLGICSLHPKVHRSTVLYTILRARIRLQPARCLVLRLSREQSYSSGVISRYPLSKSPNSETPPPSPDHIAVST